MEAGLLQNHAVTDYDTTDPRLWVRLDVAGVDSQLRWLIAGNAHTHRGHFHVCSAIGNLHRSVNHADVAEASEESRIWLEGFLHGQEPDLWVYLGSDPDLNESAADADLIRWQHFNRAFRGTGSIPQPLETLPSARPELVGPSPPPWCFVGGLYRVQTIDGWVAADPQPTGDGWYWPNSVCQMRDEHSMEMPSDDVSACEDCHLVSAN